MSSITESYQAGIVGWDIGGVNLKCVRVAEGARLTSRSVPFEIQRSLSTLAEQLSVLHQKVRGEAGDRHAVTMTAELSQLFRSKREGVNRILDSVRLAFGEVGVRVFTTDGRFLTIEEARHAPIAVAASNWSATARLVARAIPDCILIDIGSTTTDIIPIAGGEVVASGATDPGRLASGELVYTGVLRSPVESFASTVPYDGRQAFVSAEGFAISGDVWLTLGRIREGDYSAPTPDGRPKTAEFARERLARVICADLEMLSGESVQAIAEALGAAQGERVREGLSRVRQRQPALTTAVVTGLGSFLARQVAEQEGLKVIELADRIGADAGKTAPAAAVALLLGADG
ncbi:MAG TPA: hydantoinase/oxoprolinase family protein [Gemmatimonadales bacterium]|nr:hydantoinase/oxoprolinase family protein [Gemmatimonadales bacterium]